MRYFFDTEFIEDGKTIDLISIGIVCEDGREFYAISSEADYQKANANPWVHANVLTRLPGGFLDFGREFRLDLEHPTVMPRTEIMRLMLPFIGNTFDDTKPEFWAYYADYDWVVFCQLFGTMMDLPSWFPMYCRDIKQLCDMLGNPPLPEQGEDEHNALADARWNKEAFDFLRTGFEGELIEMYGRL